MVNILYLEDQAIEAAVNARWQEAVKLNEELLSLKHDDIDACLRLGFAYLQLNSLADATRIYKRALRIQPKNIIAMEHLEKIEILLSKKKPKSLRTTKFDPDLFLEIPGKTRTVRLTNIGQKEDIAGRNIGEEVFLKEKKRRLEVRSSDNEYIGTLPDDISKRLIYFVQEKSVYSVYIKEVDLTDVVIFIKEISKGARVRQYPSFPSNPHIMLTDIQQLEADDDDPDAEEDEDDESGDLETHGIEENAWEEDESEDKDLDSIIQVEEEEEEEE